MNYNFQEGDSVITTRGNVGIVTEVIECEASIEISPEFEGYNLKNGIPMMGANGEVFYSFSKDDCEDLILIQGVDFDFKNENRYVVQFQKNKVQFHPASLRLFDREFVVNTIQTDNGVETHIECKHHKKLPNGPIISSTKKYPVEHV